MSCWAGDGDTPEAVSVIENRLQVEFRVEALPVSREIEGVLSQLRSAELRARIRSGF